MGAQITLVDRARAALNAGDPRTALKHLDLYDRSFTEHYFSPEALYLRMRAHARLGDGAAAERIAHELLEQHPRSPQARQAAALLANSTHKK
jgi:outer membrane protein assembly factor BamD (BamD/ComL family)